MKIRIITIHDIGNNFGSAIQSCALCEYLNAQGYDAEIIHYTPNYRNWKQELRYRLVNLLFCGTIGPAAAALTAIIAPTPG